MGKKILIVEDEESVGALLLTIFEGLDYEVSYAKDGEEGVLMARQGSPDIILLDAGLPQINGYDMCRIVKADPALSHAKIIMLSGLVQNSDLQRARQAGADDYVAKPFSAVALMEKVVELLSRDR